jgi:hypothetical protein
MRRIAFRVGLRLSALVVAFGCGWTAFAIAPAARSAVCPSDAWKGIHLAGAPGACFTDPAIRWQTAPTIATTVAALIGLAFALAAVSRRQGTFLTYRWRRAIY